MTGPTLALLIQQAKGRRVAKGHKERSFRELKDTADAAGHHSTLSSWQQWAMLDYERKLMPDPATIRAFAAGLEVSETEVVLAAARQLGLDVGEGNDADLVLPGAGHLPPEDRNVLATLAAVLVAKGGAGRG
ncbi:hypothetical protein ACFFGR_09545 [Arthrobacter liuii]|uniref:Uncharacterized protein n=1 Tax=Arthrobacter liuii TaxID=1476996 RepID=A0ABQ2AM86_9MICC|nr:hypothetical protein [Arthrobacter liuii]GGH93973.1 hypothetical protein GCM10007170_16090 [Arthrobacter liuii]